MRDTYSNFAFYQAVAPAVYGADYNGPDINLQGYQACMFTIEVGDVDVSLATSKIQLRMQHTDASALGLGPSTYCDVTYGSYLLHSTISQGHTITSGVVFEFSVSGTSVADFESTVYFCGYKGPRQYVRLVVESAGTANAGSTYVGATAILGYPANWPVNAAI